MLSEQSNHYRKVYQTFILIVDILLLVTSYIIAFFLDMEMK